MLNAKIAQKIVDKTMSIININVNIMNADSEIIASGDRMRLGDFHLGAYKVIKSGKSHLVSSQEAKNMPGVLPGITLPILFRDEIIGAVGMTGEPDLVINYGELVKYTTELMIEQSYIKDEVFLQKRLRDSFMEGLFMGNIIGDHDDIVERGLKYGLDLNQRYLVMSIKVEFEESNSNNKNGNSAVDNQRKKDRLEEKITLQIFKYSKIIIKFIDNYLGVLIPLKTDSKTLENHNEQYKVAKEVLDSVRKLINAKFSMAIGGISNSNEEISSLFKKAMFTISAGYINKDENEIKHFSDYFAEYAMSYIPQHAGLNISKQVLGNFSSKSEGQTETLLQTLQIFFKYDMNITKASEELFIHRNSLVGRLKRITEITGYKPQNFRDAVILNLAMTLPKLEEHNLTHKDIYFENQVGMDSID